MSHPVTKTSYCVQLKQFKTQSKLRDSDNWLCNPRVFTAGASGNTFEIHSKYIEKPHKSDPNSWCLRSQKMTKKRSQCGSLEPTLLCWMRSSSFCWESSRSWYHLSTSLLWVLSCVITIQFIIIYPLSNI